MKISVTTRFFLENTGIISSNKSQFEANYTYVCKYTHVCLAMCVCLVAQSCKTVSMLWTVTQQAPLSMGISRQEYWNMLSSPPPGGLPDSGIEPERPASSEKPDKDNTEKNGAGQCHTNE